MKHILRLLFFWVLSCGLVFGQGRMITGTVTDAEGNPIPGVTILIKGSTQGAATGMNGEYSINANEGDVLVFRFIGFASQEVTVGNQSNINISLADDNRQLDEVVVTGLATSVKRSNLANAVSTISAQDLVGVTNPATFDAALYGKLTGANITQSSGAPGGGISIRLRGISSIVGQNQPLFIVDGVYMDNSELPSGVRFASGANAGNEENTSNRMADIDPQDIESIEVLKGASAAAIYGTRANAGVVIITTKRGSAGKTKFTFSQDIGGSRVIRLLGQRDFTEDRVLADFGEVERQRFVAARNAGQLRDYEREIYGNTGLITDTRFTAVGGDNKTKFYVGGGYRSEEGIIRFTGHRRLSLRLNIDHKVSDFFDIAVSSSFVNSNADRGFTGNENEGGLSYGYNLAFTRPWAQLMPVNGNYPDNPYASGNPLLVRDLAKNQETTYRTIQSIRTNFNLLRRDNMFLKATISGGLDYFSHQTYVFVPETHQAQRGLQNGFLGVGNNKVLNTNYQGLLVFNASAMNNQLDLTTQAGFTTLRIDRDLIYNQATQLVPGQTTLGQSGAQSLAQTLEFEQDFGFFAQQEANYDDKIIATLGIRLDKSTRNGEPNRYYAFPKASLALNLANFDFWTISPINQFKLRAAYGETGSSAIFGATFTGFNPNNIAGTGGSIISPQSGNTALQPERAQEFETGVDIGFLQSRIFLEATYYNRNVTDLILQRSTPASSGFTSEFGNFADLVNQGIELSLGAAVLKSENIVWNTTFNFWFNRSKVTRLDVPAFAPAGSAFGLGLGTFFIEEGRPVTQLKGINSLGETITVGDVEPTFQLGWMNSLTFFKQFDLSFLWHWKEGGNNLNLTNLLTDIIGRTSADYDTPAGIARRNTVGTIRYIEDASYIRLREVSLYYRFKGDFLRQNLGNTLTGLKIGVSAYNPLTFTNYSSYDPEVSTKGGAGLSTGIEVAPFPTARRAFFHLVANF